MSNNDNQMTRFLFAILRQKCLKDIDWNEVAKDPILAQPITNGHAARMRYSRFKAAMLGLEPQKRAKNGVTKPKAKPKKEAKPKNEDPVKSEHRDVKPLAGVKREASPPRAVKEEQKPQPFRVQFTPVSMADSPTEVGGRLLTPCSDEALQGNPNLLMTPASEMLSASSTFDMGHCEHEHNAQGAWGDMPLFSEFDAAYGTVGYGDGMCEHQMEHSHLQGYEAGHDHGHELADGVLDMGSSIHVKTEPWDSQQLV
ncbi:hypothetical protein VUR80DRAFT_9853 [Thermomyces stellatus]